MERAATINQHIGMKTRIIIAITTILFAASAYAQDTTKIVIQKGVPIYKDTTDVIFSKVWLPEAAVIYIIDYKGQHKYYPLQYKNATYYVYDSYLKGLPTGAGASSTSIIDRYVKMYGKPDDTSDFSSGDYKSKTYTWYCADGKYRSVDFEFKNNKWVVGSEHTSDCIR